MIEEEERIGQLEQREQSMRQLESDIVDVNTIFKVSVLPIVSRLWGISGSQDLATMVHEQGEIVDSIEQNIESTTVQVRSCLCHLLIFLFLLLICVFKVTSGTEQLRQAADYQNKVILLDLPNIMILSNITQIWYWLFQARKKKIILAVLGIIILCKNNWSFKFSYSRISHKTFFFSYPCGRHS